MSNDRPLTKTFYAALGRVAVEFAYLEDEVRKLLSRLMESDYGLVIAAGESIGNLLAMCQRIAAFDPRLDNATVDRLTRLIALINLMIDERNSALHASWYPTDHAGHFCGLRSKRPNGKTPESLTLELYWTVEKITSIADDIRTTRSFITLFAESLSGRPPIIPWSRATVKRIESVLGGWGVPPSTPGD